MEKDWMGDTPSIVEIFSEVFLFQGLEIHF